MYQSQGNLQLYIQGIQKKVIRLIYICIPNLQHQKLNQ